MSRTEELLRHCDSSLIQGETTKAIKQLVELVRLQIVLVKRYRNETPLGHQPHMIAHVADEAIAAFERFEQGGK